MKNDNLLEAVQAYIDANGLPEEAARKFVDYSSERGQLVLRLASILMGRPVRYLAPFDSRVAKLASVFLFNEAGEVLVTRRSNDMPDAPGTWGFPGGNGNRGETFRQIALRQVAEEVGLCSLTEECLIATLYPVEATGDYGGEIGREQVQLAFIALLDEEQQAACVPKDETSEIRWVAPEHVGRPGEAEIGLGFYEIDSQLLELALEARALHYVAKGITNELGKLVENIKGVIA